METALILDEATRAGRNTASLSSTVRSIHHDQATLRLYALNNLPSYQMTTLQNHLADCEYCQYDLRRMEEMFLAPPTLHISTLKTPVTS